VQREAALCTGGVPPLAPALLETTSTLKWNKSIFVVQRGSLCSGLNSFEFKPEQTRIISVQREAALRKRTVPALANALPGPEPAPPPLSPRQFQGLRDRDQPGIPHGDFLNDPIRELFIGRTVVNTVGKWGVPTDKVTDCCLLVNFKAFATETSLVFHRFT